MDWGFAHHLTFEKKKEENQVKYCWLFLNKIFCSWHLLLNVSSVGRLSIWFVAVKRKEKLLFLQFSLRRAMKMFIWRYSSSFTSPFTLWCISLLNIKLQVFSPCVLLLKLPINFCLQVCDLSSVTEIKSFATRFSLKDKPLHVLVKLPYLLL